MIWTCVWLGLAGGLTSGLLGVGGGVVLVPLMLRFLRLEQKHAHGTSLAILVVTATAAALTYKAIGTVDLRLAAWLAVGATACAPLGARLTARWSQARLRRVFGVVLALIGVRLCVVALPGLAWLPTVGAGGVAALLVTGGVVGFLSGLLGVGGGTILVPLLTLLFGTEQHLAQGVSLFMIIPTSIAGAWTHARLGHVHWRIVWPVAAASILAAVAGAKLAHVLPATTLKVAFGVLLVWVGGRLALTSPPKKAAPVA